MHCLSPGNGTIADCYEEEDSVSPINGNVCTLCSLTEGPPHVHGGVGQCLMGKTANLLLLPMGLGGGGGVGICMVVEIVISPQQPSTACAHAARRRSSGRCCSHSTIP